MIDYFNNLYDDVFEYTYESLTDDIVYNGYIITEATGEGVILTETKSGNKKIKTKKDVIKLIRNTTIVLLLVIGLLKVIKKKIEKIKKKAEETGYKKGITDSNSKAYKSGQEVGYKQGYYHGTNAGLKKGYENGLKKGLVEREKGKMLGYKYGQEVGTKNGYKKGWKERGTSDNIPHKAAVTRINSDEYYYSYLLNDMMKYVMSIDSVIAKRNGGKSVYDGNDIFKTLDNYIEVLQKQNKRLKGCQSQIFRVDKNKYYIEEIEAYKEVFELAKSAKIISNKVILLGNGIDVPIPDKLKQKLEEL